MEAYLALPLMAVLLLLKGFFSGSEIALVNADKLKLQHRARKGDPGAKRVLEAFERPETLLTTTLVGTNLATVSLTTVGTVMMIHYLGKAGDLWAFVVFTPLFLILGEVVPKSIYQQRSDTLSPRIIYPLRAVQWLLWPVITFFSFIARMVARIVAGPGKAEGLQISREQLSLVVKMAEESGALGSVGDGEIRRVIRFAVTTAAEAMIPMAEVTGIHRIKTTRDALELSMRFGYGRLPVYEGSTSNVVGLVRIHFWDAMDPEFCKRPLESLIRPVMYTSPDQTIDELLPTLSERDDQAAIVVDEYGSATGMITLEDIVGQVIGDTDIGYAYKEQKERARRTVQKIAEGRYRIDARVPIAEVNERLGTTIPTTDYHTLGGFVFATLRRIPRQGDVTRSCGYAFVVEEATDRAAVSFVAEFDAGE